MADGDKPWDASAVEALLALEAIKNTKARYFRFMDSKDWRGFEALFATDAAFDMREASGIDVDPAALCQGASAITTFVRQAVGRLITVHQGTGAEIEMTSESTARATWAMTDLLVVPPGVEMPFRRLRGFGHYHDTYERIDGVWLIKSSRLTRLHVDVTT